MLAIHTLMPVFVMSGSFQIAKRLFCYLAFSKALIHFSCVKIIKYRA